MQNMLYDFSTLRDCSADFSRACANLEQIRSDLENIRSSADDFWKGDGKNAYSERCSELIKTLDKLNANMEKNKEKLDKAIEIQSSNESNIEIKVNNLSADNIF